MSTVVGLKTSGLVAGLGWRTWLLLGFVSLAAVIFWVVAALPYLLLDASKLGQYPSRQAWVLG